MIRFELWPLFQGQVGIANTVRIAFQTNAYFCLYDRCSGVEHFILEIIDELPDMEFVLNSRDWPQSSTHGPPLPIFSFSKVVSMKLLGYPCV